MGGHAVVFLAMFLVCHWNAPETRCALDFTPDKHPVTRHGRLRLCAVDEIKHTLKLLFSTHAMPQLILYEVYVVLWE